MLGVRSGWIHEGAKRFIRVSRLDFTSGHSSRMTLYQWLCRMLPSGMIMWLRKTPSNFAPIPAIAVWDLRFSW